MMNPETITAGPDSTSPVAPVATTVPAPKRPKMRSWWVRGLTAVAGVAVGVGLFAAPAHAAVNPYGPHQAYNWSNCRILIGDQRSTPSYAVGDTQINCSTNHRISVYTTLYRWSGSWVPVERSYLYHYAAADFVNMPTPAYGCSASAYWYTVGTVSLDGSSYYNLPGPVAAFAPCSV